MELSKSVPQFLPIKIRVFIIEDYVLTRVALIAALKKFPELEFVGQAESAEDALFILPNAQPDIVLLDLGLPGMSGIEMAQLLQKIMPKLKVIILTSHNDEMTLLRSIGNGAGAQGYVLKDVKPDNLFEIIQAVYNGSAWLDPFIASIVYNLLNQPSHIHSTNDELTDTRLTQSEIDILEHIVDGKSCHEIAGFMDVSFITARHRVANILEKLSLDDRIQTVIKSSEY